MRERVFVALGSNIQPEQHLAAAVAALKERGVRPLRVSPVYRTEPLGEGYGRQAFLNAVLEVATELSPRELKFAVLRPVEAALGRRARAGPRTADLDLLAYGARVLRERDLVLPDPDWLVRPFLAAGMAALAPAVKHPQTGETAREIAARLVREPLAEVPPLTRRLRALIRS